MFAVESEVCTQKSSGERQDAKRIYISTIDEMAKTTEDDYAHITK